MKPLTLVCLAAALALAGVAHAQSYRDDVRYEDDPYVRDGGYDYARVVRVDPVIVRDRDRDGGQRCYDRPAGEIGTRDGDYYGDRSGYGGASPNPAGRSLATVVGGVVGAVAGSRFGGGSGQLLGTAVGTMVGGVAGRSVYDASHPVRQGTVRVCDPAPYDERDRVDGYDVTYEYAGRTYRTHSDYNPGERIRVRIEPAPE